MNARQAKHQRVMDEAAFRQQVLDLVGAQKSVIGALARAVTKLQKDVDALKLQHADSLIISGETVA